ncbi:uncharacterized protein LOC116935885 isoform X2 [Daphnia magna]|uniref:uncharacterized protein LOC116935885 isoform X2 n=1 Tax=Daphnia magna TaxID=35525 RepID=UPI001E1BD9E4|nr:uncharacterized protein LOC116935885 isoform X2 [Daphnia magna]
MMRDSSDEEVSNYFDNDDQEKEQIRRQNTLEMWRWKAKAACLLYLLLKRRRRRLSANNLRPVEKSLADGFTFRNITRMSPTLFNKLLWMDDAFPLKKKHNEAISRPKHRIINKRRTNIQLQMFFRLSRARRTIENAFGIVTNKLRIFRKPMIGSPQNVENYIKAGVVLHNMLIREDSRFYLDNQKLPDHFDVNGVLIEGAWRTDSTMTSMFRDLRPGKGMNYPTVAKNIRDQFTKYFSNEGAVPWQRVIVEDTGRLSEEEG